MIVEPGDLLCFSGAHLHASVPNTSGVTRFSLEARTVNVDDVASRRGAPNLDGQAPRIPLDWFHHIEDEVPLPEVMVRRDGRE
jgi:ectoine hydroxylase-related dioxygenase (phytanoyl-CoA dioxygenase family)